MNYSNVSLYLNNLLLFLVCFYFYFRAWGRGCGFFPADGEDDQKDTGCVISYPVTRRYKTCCIVAINGLFWRTLNRLMKRLIAGFILCWVSLSAKSQIGVTPPQGPPAVITVPGSIQLTISYTPEECFY